MGRRRQAEKKRKGIGLQTRMTISYLGVTILNMLLLEILAALTFFIIISRMNIPPGTPRPAGGTLEPNIFGILQGILYTGLFWLIVMAPAGTFFGILLTRGLVRRIRRLIQATARFAEGDYTQRVRVTKRDEVGQLESQFNTMAEQLVESIRKRQELAEYNARIEERARIEQELQTARLIQHSLLPKKLPELSGWQLAAYYQPAREVGGDLYDCFAFPDGRLGLVIGDVTDKGIPAAMVMASTRSMLRAAAQTSDSPGEVLARVNNLLYTETPERMFVTCFYGILDPADGRLRFANAGHDLPYQRAQGDVAELLARGMPLGLMPGMSYEEQEAIVGPGESILFYSDGLVEAHNPAREMFGFPRLKTLLVGISDQVPLISSLLNELEHFTGREWEQEDDVTLVTLQRTI
ncbi:MAG TPA: PP2C family protein-serine/threonine phosphatase [Ktedonobacteraceae bacterium]|jgi:serine phosphatase RsbU (regulator of sigma subunit)